MYYGHSTCTMAIVHVLWPQYMYYGHSTVLQGVRGAQPPGIAGGAGAARPRFAGGAGAARPRFAGPAVLKTFGLRLFLGFLASGCFKIFCPPAVLKFVGPRLFRLYFCPAVFGASLYDYSNIYSYSMNAQTN